ncbi:MAG: GDP-mannose 4,6-dehydratase [Methanoregula sp.]|nr:GDP-mannose 4,6-dehydratase [Methanoregula sp.]
MNAIIFGANGQDGHYLTEVLYQKKIEVIEVSRNSGDVIGDVSNYSFVENQIKNIQPTYIFHLAANSTTKHNALFENHETISTGTLNILEAVKRHCPNSKVFITGSGVQFRNKGMPIKETDEFEANSPYSLARIHSVYAARYYRSLGLNVYVGYLFHHESPLRKPHHVSQMIALAVQRIAGGSDEVIELGDISVEKEWTFAGDITRGILTLVEQDKVFEAVIGSGVGYTIENWLEQCFGILGKDWHYHVRLRDGFTSEYKRLISNPETIKSLGWHPTEGLSDLAERMVMQTSPEIL